MKRSRIKFLITITLLFLLVAGSVLGLHIHRFYTWADELEKSKSSDNYSLIIDSITCDVDDDWFDEICILTPGPTSGLFTFSMTVFNFSGTEYKSTFCTEFYYLSFMENSDGTVQVWGETQGESPTVHYFDISLQDGYVVLSENGEFLPYWGN